jgi:hypothetical protein
MGSSSRLKTQQQDLIRGRAPARERLSVHHPIAQIGKPRAGRSEIDPDVIAG